MEQAKEIKGTAERIIKQESTRVLASNEVIKIIRKGYWSHKENGRLAYREGMHSTIIAEHA